MIQAQVVPNPTAGYCTMQEARTDLVLRWHCEPDPARFGSWSWRERALRAAARRLCTPDVLKGRPPRCYGNVWRRARVREGWDIASYRGVACWSGAPR